MTFFVNVWPSYGIPELVKLTVANVEVLPETERVQKVIQQKQRKEELEGGRKRKRRLKEAQHALERAQQEVIRRNN